MRHDPIVRSATSMIDHFLCARWITGFSPCSGTQLVCPATPD
jgi:hypothetical protein